jgi:putative hydrolase of the HAD superfamily
MPYKAFSFDLWNTLIVSNPAFKGEQVRLLADFWQISPDILAPQLTYLDKDLDKKAEKKGVQTNFAERLRLLAQKLACHLPTEAEARFLEDEQERLFLANLPTLSEPNVGELLQHLHEAGKILFLVSNTGFIAGKTLQRAMQMLGIDAHWQARLFSDEIGYSKPDKRIFEPLFQFDNLLPQNILHIGDNFLTDYYGARKNGLFSFLYTKNLRTFEPKLDTIESLWDLHRFIE